ncbi:MAG: universal stress protein [Gammaproteobacteria bacterium]|nr:universal stress protein [Gammaproteobacteria bacterium]MBT8110153.1 universal stress protein [Gammaproteobacteria bacterium]NND46925.1 universal stress protein [Woeseiaceae bacterium]NNL44856.1 universal stress protein [Woeseiaceae bacterium]
MKEISRILAVVDPTTEDQPALRRAAWLAKKNRAELELLVCYYNEYLSGDRLFDSPSLEKARDEVIQSHEKYLEKLAEPLRADGIVVKTTARWDHPLYEGVVRRAVESKADLIVKDTHHHSAVARVLLTNTDWNLIRTCPMPLWLVKPVDFADPPVFVAAIDPMHQHDKPAALDDEILHVSKALAKNVGGHLHAFHSYDPRIAVATATANAYIPVSLPFDEIEKQMHEDHQKRFREITEFHKIEDGRAHLVAGLTHEELPIIADELKADVVVMGAVARNRWKRLFIGATAERTLEHLPCDLLIIKPDWFKTPVDLDSHEAA